MIKEIKQDNLLSLMNYGSGGMHIENVFKDQNKHINLLILGSGQHLKPHAMPSDVFVICLEGRARVVFLQQEYILEPMDYIVFPKNELHEVFALKDLKLLLVK